METKNNIIITNTPIHPGESVLEWLNDIGITQKEFCKQANIPASHFNEFVKGKRNMTDSLSKSLSTILGMSPEFWIGLQANYEYNKKMLAIADVEEKINDTIENELRIVLNLRQLYQSFDIHLSQSTKRVQKLLSIFNTDNYSDLISKATSACCFKHSDTLKIDEKNMRTWVLLALHSASQHKPIGSFTECSADVAADSIAQLANSGEITVQDIETILSNNGISYSVVKKLDGCPIDGYSVIANGIPSIVVTYRHNNMEKLIFDVLHEIGHIKLHLQDGGYVYGLINAEYSQNNAIESEANEFARDKLIAPNLWKQLLSIEVQNLNFNSICVKIGQRAEQLGINPYIAVARYKHDKKAYKSNKYLPTKIR